MKEDTYRIDSIYWIQRNHDIIGVLSDNDTHFLTYQILTGELQGSLGSLNKHYADIWIGRGDWKIVTNPLEALVLECFGW